MANLTHFIVTSGESGDAERVPLKSWLRRNPEVLPGVDPTAMTTHQLRSMLRRNGWRQTEVGDDVLLFQPGLADVETGTIIAAIEAEEDIADNEGDREFAFELEHQLRDFLISNLSSISLNGKRLKLFVDEAGRSGKEYPTDIGFIDVLAVDDSDAFYVFELKRGRTSDHTVGQILRYMGWCQKRLASDRPVHGVIVAQSHSEKLKFAASVVPGLFIFEYSIEFRLNAVEIV